MDYDPFDLTFVALVRGNPFAYTNNLEWSVACSYSFLSRRWLAFLGFSSGLGHTPRVLILYQPAYRKSRVSEALGHDYTGCFVSDAG